MPDFDRVQRYIARNEWAVDALCARWRMYGDDAEDLKQEVRVRMYEAEARGTIDWNRTNEHSSTFLYAVALNTLRTLGSTKAARGRRRQYSPEPDLPLPDPLIDRQTPEDALERTMRSDALHKCAGGLRGYQRATFEHAMQELPVAEGAALLELNLNTYKTHRHRMMNELRNQLT